MRAVFAVSLLLLLCPAAAPAQTAAGQAAPADNTTLKSGDITREDYVERARRNAEKRFDRMDANHDGVLTAEERRAARANRKRRAAPPQPSQ
jgi:hypothetical protein